MHMMDRMMEFMMGRMSEADKEDMMSKMMDKFVGGMSPEDKKEMMAEMMPKMMAGIDMSEMMPKMMMGMMSDMEKGMGKMPGMMAEMMPHCLEVMLPRMQPAECSEFALKIIPQLIERATEGMSASERASFLSQVSTSFGTEIAA